jgi:hypothetical protein
MRCFGLKRESVGHSGRTQRRSLCRFRKLLDHPGEDHAGIHPEQSRGRAYTRGPNDGGRINLACARYLMATLRILAARKLSSTIYGGADDLWLVRASDEERA